MQAIAAGVDARTLDAELGPMVHRSLFFALRQGEPVSQADVDQASKAFLGAIERLVPTSVLHDFTLHACASGVVPILDHAELAPGFTEDESFAWGDAAARKASPNKKLTRAEVLECLRWNQAEPVFPTAVAHVVDLTHTYVAAIAEFVAARDPLAAERLAPFVAQWQPKNVLKFVNVATYVAAKRRAKGGKPIVDQAAIAEGITLLDKSGAFTWSSRDDASTASLPPVRIHCPAQAFLHKLLANQATLAYVFRFVSHEAGRRPLHPDLAASLEFVRSVARREELGIVEHGQGWSQQKLETRT